MQARTWGRRGRKDKDGGRRSRRRCRGKDRREEEVGKMQG